MPSNPRVFRIQSLQKSAEFYSRLLAGYTGNVAGMIKLLCDVQRCEKEIEIQKSYLSIEGETL